MDISSVKHPIAVMQASVQIGKSGLTSGIIDEIKNQVKKNKLVKVKLLRSYISGKDKKVVFAEIAEKTGLKMIEKVGFAVVLGKKTV